MLCSAQHDSDGPVAQLVERLICTEEVGGSIPLGSTILFVLSYRHNATHTSRSQSGLCVEEYENAITERLGYFPLLYTHIRTIQWRCMHSLRQ